MLGNSNGGVYVKTLRKGGVDKNDVKTVGDLDEAVDLFIYHVAACVLAPYGGWRRAHLSVEEVWLAGVRGGQRIVGGMKRRGVFTVADLWKCMKGQAKSGDGDDDEDGLFNGLFIAGAGGDEEKIRNKCRDLLLLLEDVLWDAMGEDGVKQEGEGESGGGGGSVYSGSGAGSSKKSWARLTNLDVNIKVARVRSHGRGLDGGGFRKATPLGDSWLSSGKKQQQRKEIRIPGSRPLTR
jgi:hypothetical protein